MKKTTWRNKEFTDGDTYDIELSDTINGTHGSATSYCVVTCVLELEGEDTLVFKSIVEGSIVFRMNLSEIDKSWDKDEFISDCKNDKNSSLEEILEDWGEDFSLDTGFSDKCVLEDVFEGFEYLGNIAKNPELKNKILEDIEELNVLHNSHDIEEEFLEVAEKIGYQGERKSW